MKKVLVLLSSYNGAKFIEEQIISIMNQKYVDVSIHLRDDGSIDNTVDVVNSLDLNSKIHITYGKNIGWARSFFWLLMNCSQSFDYFAFSDQDDYWYPEKLSRAIKKIEENNKYSPTLYSSDLEIVDENLSPSKINIHRKRNINKKSALVENVASGCTMVFNSKFLQLVRKYEPTYLHAHDYWLYLIAVYSGNIVLDDKKTMAYRQHESNSIGSEQKIWKLWRNRIKKMSISYLKKIFGEHPLENQAIELLKGYRWNISCEDRLFLSEFCNYRSCVFRKIKMIFNPSFSNQYLTHRIRFIVRAFLGIL